MKIVERINTFVKSVGKAYVNEEFEHTNIRAEDEEKQKEETVKEAHENQSKVEKLYDALKSIKEQLENKELSPFKRLILQLKLDFIETRLDKQLAKVEIEHFKADIEERKVHMYEKYNEKLEQLQREYDAILDKKGEIEKGIEDLVGDVKERKAANSKEEKDPEQIEVYNYEVGLKTMNDLEDRKNALQNIINDQAAKEEEIDNIINQFHDKEADIDEQVNNKLRKYNTFRLNWESIKAFFSRAKNSIAEWRKNRKAEKEAKNNPEEVAEDSIQTFDDENKETISDFKDRLNVNIPLEEQKEFAEEINEEDHVKTGIEKAHEAVLAVEAEKEANKNSAELTEDLIGKVQRGEDTEGYTDRIVEKLKEEAQKRYDNNVESHEENIVEETIEEPITEPIVENNETMEEEHEVAEDNSRAERLSNLVKPHNLAIRTYQNEIDRLERQLKRSKDADEIAELKLKIAARGNDINDHRRMRDEKIEEYRREQNSTEEPEQEKDEKPEDDNRSLEEQYNDYMETVEDTPERLANVEKFNIDYEAVKETMRQKNENVKKALDEKKKSLQNDEQEIE